MRTVYLILILLIYASNILIAQAPFDPSHPNLILWLSPDEGLYNSLGQPAAYGDDIYEWHDLSGNGYVFENTVTSNRPNLINEYGKNYLDFTPGDFLQNVAIRNQLNGLDEFSIFMVIKSDVIGTDKGFLESENPDNNDDNICLRYDNVGANTGRNNCLKTGMVGNSPNHQVESQANVQTTERQVLTLTWKRSERLYLYVDGFASDSSNLTFDNVISNINKILIGKGPKDGALTGNGGWDGKIGDVIFFSKKLPKDSVYLVFEQLPVELTGFSAEAKSNSVLIKWETASEVNNDYFVIDRSEDGFLFNTIGFMDGSANSNENLKYEYTDSDPIEGVSYYRLSQVDLNGKTTFFQPVSVLFEINNKELHVFYEQDNLTIKPQGFNESYQVFIYTIEGKELFFISITDDYNIPIKVPVQANTTQALIVSYWSAGELYSQKVIVSP